MATKTEVTKTDKIFDVEEYVEKAKQICTRIGEVNETKDVKQKEIFKEK